jgi:hypothetical protein
LGTTLRNGVQSGDAEPTGPGGKSTDDAIPGDACTVPGGWMADLNFVMQTMLMLLLAAFGWLLLARWQSL